MTVKKNKQAPAPPTMLVITLEADGSGSLLARRGELAHLSQFTYQGLAEIVAAIQHSATELIAIEQDPPTLDTPPAQPEVTPNVEPESVEASDTIDESPVEEVTAEVPSSSASADVDSVTPNLPDLQPKLF